MSKLELLAFQIRGLSREDRQIIAEIALDMPLDQHPDTEIEAAWDAKIDLRIDEIDEGAVVGLDPEVVIAELRKRPSL